MPAHEHVREWCGLLHASSVQGPPHAAWGPGGKQGKERSGQLSRRLGRKVELQGLELVRT